MMPTLAVAAGRRAAASLDDRAEVAQRQGSHLAVRHHDLVVAHAVGSRWITTHDGDGVLVVVDGRFHEPLPGSDGPAALLHRRYLRRGEHFAGGVLGDFVAAVLDRGASRLLVTRDPLGVRPWYQARSGNDHAGATDIASLASQGWVDTDIDEGTTIAHLGAVTMSRGGTVYRGIRTLAPGSTWWWDTGLARIVAHHRWSLAPAVTSSWDETAEHCRALLDVAVESRLAGGEPATAELSGGLDSSSVVGTIMSRGAPDLVVARLVFDTPHADERRYSDAVAKHWGIPLVSAPPTIVDDEALTELTWRLRTPAPDPHFTMFADMHRVLGERDRRVSLTGLGGDDAFAAIENGRRGVSSIQLRQWPVVRQLGRFVALHPREAWRELVRPMVRYLTGRDHDPVPAWVRNEAADRSGLSDWLEERPEPVTGIAAIDARISNLTSGYDAAILQTRTMVTDAADRRDTHPFLDPRLIEATYGLDPWWPTLGRVDRALQVDAYRDRLPSVVAQRVSKAEFSEVFWPTLLADQVVAQVRTGPLVDLGWLDVEGFDGVVADAKQGKAHRAIPLARCVAVDRWLRSL